MYFDIEVVAVFLGFPVSAMQIEIVSECTVWLHRFVLDLDGMLVDQVQLCFLAWAISRLWKA